MFYGWAMPKSRGRKKKPAPQSQVVRMSPQMRDALLEQRAAFRAKFGRDPGPSEPIFFDPDADTPVPMKAGRMEADLTEAMQRAGIDPAKIASFKKLLRP
jgi:hypothetical protein